MGNLMTDQRKEVINQLHELNILILHTKLKATRAQTALRAADTGTATSKRPVGAWRHYSSFQNHQARQRICLTV